MEGTTTPNPPSLTSINTTPIFSYPTSYYSSSTNIDDAKSNLKTILATRVSFNDPNIVDVLIKPDEVSDQFVNTMKDLISNDPVIMAFLTDVRHRDVEFEVDMYKPLVRRNSIHASNTHGSSSARC
jgi:hypothetical protein